MQRGVIGHVFRDWSALLTIVCECRAPKQIPEPHQTLMTRR
jgi:hypothetical protein